MQARWEVIIDISSVDASYEVLAAIGLSYKPEARTKGAVNTTAAMISSCYSEARCQPVICAGLVKFVCAILVCTYGAMVKHPITFMAITIVHAIVCAKHDVLHILSQYSPTIQDCMYPKVIYTYTSMYKEDLVVPMGFNLSNWLHSPRNVIWDSMRRSSGHNCTVHTMPCPWRPLRTAEDRSA